jgi:endonuclease/exonuclease/phosphatase family metal-dependent hydrolase
MSSGLNDYDLYLINSADNINKTKIGKYKGIDVYKIDLNDDTFNKLKNATFIKKYAKDHFDTEIVEKPLGFTPDLLKINDPKDFKAVYKKRYSKYNNILIPKKVNFDDYLRIVTWNINNYFFASPDPDQVIKRIKDINADIILLNEISIDDPKIKTMDSIYNINKCNSNNNYGNVLLSDKKINIGDITEKKMAATPSRYKCYIKIDFPQYDMIIYGTHLTVYDKHNSIGNDQLEIIINDIIENKICDKNILIMGDMNKKYEFDTYDALQLKTINESKREKFNDRFKKILKNGKCNFTEVFELNKINPGLSHWSHRRIDYIFINDAFIKNYDIIPFIVYCTESDHMPVAVDIFKKIHLRIEYTSNMGNIVENNKSSHALYNDEKKNWSLNCGLITSECFNEESCNIIINECLTSTIYELFKIPVNELYLIIDDAKKISKGENNILIGYRTIVIKDTPITNKMLIDSAKEGIFIDCLLSNSNAYESENIIIDDKNSAVRFNIRGSLLYHVQGNIKDIGELQVPVDHIKNYLSFVEKNTNFGLIIHQMTEDELNSAYSKLFLKNQHDINKIKDTYFLSLNNLKIEKKYIDSMKITVNNACDVIIKRLDYYQKNKDNILTSIITLKNNYNVLLNNFKNNAIAYTELLSNIPALYRSQKYIFQNKSGVDCYITDLKTVQDNVFVKFTKHVKHLNLPQKSAILIFGSPGSGKTFCAKTLFANINELNEIKINKNIEEYVYLDLDEIRLENYKYRKMLNGEYTKKDMSKIVPWIWASTNGNLKTLNYNIDVGFKNDDKFIAVQNAMTYGSCRSIGQDLSWSGDKSLLVQCINKGYNVIYDASCDLWFHCETNILDTLRNNKYNLLMVAVKSTDEDKVINNAHRRQELDGRYMKDDYLRATFRSVPSNIQSAKNYSLKHKNVSFIIIDNTNLNCKIVI